MLRARALVSRQSKILILVLLVLAGIGGFLTYNAYAQPNTSVRTNEVTTWTANGSFTHRATVIDNESKVGPVFEPGQVVRNRSVYFRSIMPRLNGTFRFGYAADAGELETTVRQRLVIRSVGGGGGEGEQRVVYWRQARSLDRKRATLAPGERVTVPFSVNVTDAVVTASSIQERLGAPGEVRMSINVTVALSGTAGGRAVNRTVRYALPLRTDGGIYRVGSGGKMRAFTRTERVTVTEPPGALSAVGGPLLFGIGVFGLVTLAVLGYTDRLGLTEAEQAWLEYRDDRADFDEWISTVRLPEDAESLPVAEAASLADLVDIAIDTDNAVLESPEGDEYHVIKDDYRYTFVAPPDVSTSAIFEMNTDESEDVSGQIKEETRDTTVESDDTETSTDEGESSA